MAKLRYAVNRFGQWFTILLIRSFMWLLIYYKFYFFFELIDRDRFDSKCAIAEKDLIIRVTGNL